MTIGWFGRLRVECRVWMLDQQLYDLPRAQRIATRREVRTNLLDAAADVGATEALRRIGGSRTLAEQYLRAEFGDRPRASVITAIYVTGLLPLLFNFVFDEAAGSFRQSLITADPHVSGTYVWNGITYLQYAETFTFADGAVSSTGGGWTPLTFVLWALAAVVGGRLWRLLRSRSEQRAAR